MPEGMLAIVTYDSGEAIERTGDGVRGWCRGDGALDRHGRRWGRYGGGWLGGKLTGGRVGREIEDFCEHDSTVVFGGVVAVVHGAVEMEGEDRWRLDTVRPRTDGHTEQDVLVRSSTASSMLYSIPSLA